MIAGDRRPMPPEVPSAESGAMSRPNSATEGMVCNRSSAPKMPALRCGRRVT